jgi:hypothetical protein
MSIQKINSNTLAEGAVLNSIASSVNFRNRIINGDMRIDQRNAGASVTLNGNLYSVDRWGTQASLNSKATIQQSSTAPTGFTNSVVVTSSSAYSPLAADFFWLYQTIEGFNIADLNWGSASAQAVTLSFWVRSSLTGTFSVRLGSGSRSYVTTYTIASANTYEYKTVTIPGDTSGTWNATNGTGVQVQFDLGSGSNRTTATTNAWQAGDFQKATGTVSLVSTNGATLNITGVQLEAGSVATPFERRPFGTELALCQRYFWTIRGDVDGLAAGIGAGLVRASAAEQIIYCAYPATMRASPTLSGATIIVESSSLQSSDSLTGAFAGRSSARLGFSIIGLTANAAAMAWLGAATSAAFLNASAEL